jgi:hypothetical protein
MSDVPWEPTVRLRGVAGQKGGGLRQPWPIAYFACALWKRSRESICRSRPRRVWGKLDSVECDERRNIRITCGRGRSRTTSHGGEDESQTHCRRAAVCSRMDKSRVWAGGTSDRCTNCWRRFRGESGGNCGRRVCVAQNPVQERAGLSNADRYGACAGQSGDHRTDAETGGKPATKCDERRTNETER